MADNVQTAFGFARALLLDDPAQPQYDDAYLMPLLNMALRELRDSCMAATEDGSAEYVVVIAKFPQGTTDLSSYLAPGKLLANLIAPIEILEKPAGTPDSRYTQVRMVDRLPVLPVVEYLYQYEWRGDCVYFRGATQDLDLQVRYEGVWPTVSSAQDAIPGPNLAHILGQWTAAKVPMLAPQVAAAWLTEAKHLGYLWLNRQVKTAQEKPIRLRPFRPKRGSWNGMSGSPFF